MVNTKRTGSLLAVSSGSMALDANPHYALRLAAYALAGAMIGVLLLWLLLGK